MAKERKVVLLVSGTGSTVTPPTKGFGLFSLVSKVMNDSNLIINQLFKIITEANVRAFNGAATDIATDSSPASVMKSLLGFVHANASDNGPSATLKDIEDHLIKQYEEAKGKEEELVIYAAGWSRGAQMLGEIPALMAKNGIKAKIVHLDRIDSVIGGPTDKFEVAYDYYFNEKAEVEANVCENNYISPTGNLVLWDQIGSFIKKFTPNSLNVQINTPFFSGSVPFTENKTANINGKEYSRSCSNKVCPANHEGIAGRKEEVLNKEKQKVEKKVEELVGAIILGELVCHIIDLHIEVDTNLAMDALQTAQNAAAELKSLNLPKLSVEQINRKFLDLKKLHEVKSFISMEFLTAAKEALIGRSLQTSDKVENIGDSISDDFFSKRMDKLRNRARSHNM